MEFHLRPVGLALKQDQDLETGEFSGDRTLVFGDGVGNFVLVGPLNDEEWGELVAFVVDPKKYAEAQEARMRAEAEAHAARSKLVVPGGVRDAG